MTSMFRALGSCEACPERASAWCTLPPVVFVVSEDEHVRRSLEQLSKTAGFDLEIICAPGGSHAAIRTFVRAI